MKKIEPLQLRIHCLDQSDNILTFQMHLVALHDYVISDAFQMHTILILLIPF